MVVRARAVDSGGAVEISVIDRGPGIPPHQLALVFEPLWRADVSQTGISRGAGLGLAIVRGLAEMHGGEASVSSVKGRGSTFRVLLPGRAYDEPDLDAAFAKPKTGSRRR